VKIKMNAKITLALVALVSVGVFALPSTVALFAGQHSFVNIDETGNQIDCIKCHGDIQSELGSQHSSVTNTSGPHAAMKCEFCHRLQVGQASGDNAYALVTYSDSVMNLTTGKATTATETRYAIINPADYEAGTYPAYLNDTDVYTGLGGSHGHSAQLNPNINGTPVCTYPECDTSNPTIVANLLLAKGATLGVDVSGRTTASLSGVSLSPTFDKNGAFVSAPTGKVLNAYGTALCGGQLKDPNNISAGFVNQTICPGAAGKLYPLVVNGVPLDNITATQFTGFQAGNVAWAQNGTTNWQTTGIFDTAGSRDSATGSKYHAASLISCLDCHGGSSPIGHETDRLSMDCELCHYGGEAAGTGNQFRGINAGGFGMGLTSSSTDTGTLEVHKGLMGADTGPNAVGYVGGRYVAASNSACIACHTHVQVNITYSRPDTMVFTSTEGTTGNWSIGDITAIGTNVTHS
jgi:hypothetical protein